MSLLVFFFVQKFGYKKGFSTDLCTGLLKLVSSRYIHHGSKVRCALLDMSKAFDMVDHGQLFETLCQRNLPNPVYSIFAAMVQQPACGNQVELYSIFTFSTDKRSSTGRGLIPNTVYIDELLQRLQKLGVGCHWEGMFVGGLCYADDLALIAPSAHALRRMLQVCSDFASEKNLMQGKLNSLASVHS